MNMGKNYKIIGYYSEADRAYLLFVPDLPGCFADGQTLEEAKENIAVIIDEWIEYAQELGREIPKPSAYEGERLQLTNTLADLDDLS